MSHLPSVLPVDSSLAILQSSVLEPYLPAGVFLLVLALTATAMLGLSYLVGPRKASAVKSRTYECGMPVVGQARDRFSVKFYLVAILFVLFDIETVFLIPWAVKFRELGFFGFIEMMVFMSILVLGLLYAWRRGGLEWD